MLPGNKLSNTPVCCPVASYITLSSNAEKMFILKQGGFTAFYFLSRQKHFLNKVSALTTLTR